MVDYSAFRTYVVWMFRLRLQQLGTSPLKHLCRVPRVLRAAVGWPRVTAPSHGALPESSRVCPAAVGVVGLSETLVSTHSVFQAPRIRTSSQTGARQPSLKLNWSKGRRAFLRFRLLLLFPLSACCSSQGWLHPWVPAASGSWLL